MAANRPRSRQRNVTGQGKSVNRRGAGLGTGSVGSSGRRPRNAGNNTAQSLGSRPGAAGNRPHNLGNRPHGAGNRGTRSSGGGFSKIILLLIVLMLGGGGGIGSLLFGGSQEPSYESGNYDHSYSEDNDSGIDYENSGNYSGGYPSGTGNGMLQGSSLEALLGNLGGGSISSGWDNGSNTEVLDTSVADNAREKYTKLIGNDEDEVTLMVYLCGTDLESRNRMATSDLQEMINADLSENVNLLVYSGGCKAWQNSAMSSQTNQIWQVKDEGIVCLEENLGSRSMTDPDTLSYFIKWCAKEYPANRNALIFWDHGGGSVSGFGYDEKFASSGSMSLAEIDQALTLGGVTFDFVGFDACLMATTENALMLTKHADYLIASEETEPGIGWYYTDWLSELSDNTSMSTLELGRQVIDDFVETCAAKCPGQSTTLSIVDLAEVQATIPGVLADFSKDTCELIQNEEYAQVSNARSDAREFGSSSRIDQVDLVHLAKNMQTQEGEQLAKALLGAVKYNRTSSNMTNSYGLSIYFPFRKASLVDDAVGTYEQIGMDEDYMRCIQAFASMEVAGQAVSGGTASPFPTLMDMLGGENVTYGNADLFGQMLGSFLSGDVSSIAGLNDDNTDFLGGRAVEQDVMAKYLAEHSFDAGFLNWTDTENGSAIVLPQEQWELVQTLHANMFFDDGAGFIDLGTDTVYEFDEEGNLLAPSEITWLAVNEQPVAYYHESTVDDGENYSITGRIPVLYNGERAELVIEFTDENPYGRVAGVRRVYTDGETSTVGKTMNTVKDGDVLDFVCDYYSYEGEYLDSYLLGERMIVEGELMISDVYVDSNAAELTYLFTDIYNQKYWTTPVE